MSDRDGSDNKPAHGQEGTRPTVYCKYCNSWLDLEGDTAENELREHEGDFHD